MKEKDYYNKEKVYNEKLDDKIREIQLICNQEKMPMFISVAVANSENETEYKNNMVLSSTGISLSDNRIADVLLRINDIDITLPKHIERCVDDIISYLDQMEVHEEDEVDIELADDKIADMPLIIEDGCKADTKKNKTGGDETAKRILDRESQLN